MRTATFDRPVGAKLIVRLDNGEEFEPSPDDLDKFGLIGTLEAYSRFAGALLQVFDSGALMVDRRDLTDCEINPIRYLAEVAICYRSLGEVLDHLRQGDDESGDDTLDEIAGIERILRAAKAQDRA